MSQTTADVQQQILHLHETRFVRVQGIDRPAAQVLADALRRRAPLARHGQAVEDGDYMLIDPLLDVDFPADPARVTPPRSGTGYAGLSPQQRGALIEWLFDPAAVAPPSYADFYVAHLEVRLLESTPQRPHVHAWMIGLHTASAWAYHRPLERAIALGFWLLGNGTGLADWLAAATLTPQTLDAALALQARLDAPLTPAQLGRVLDAWGIGGGDRPADMLKSRLASLEVTLGLPPLDFVRAQWQEADLAPKPWRCAHRDLRIALPQPPVRALLEPHLRDLDRIPHAPVVAPPPPADTPRATPGGRAENVIILEFGQSRSDFFEYALELAQREEGFSQLLDEHRRIVYRVAFSKHRLRNFWRLWDYVQNWQHTHVYANGEELEKWKVWPYSQYMR